MENQKQYVTPYDFKGKLPLKQAIPLGLQHVLAMFVGNLTPLLVIMSACAAIGDAQSFMAIQVSLLQNAMLVAGIVTLVQLFSIGPIGGQVPIIMGTSSGFIGVFSSVANVMGGGIIAYGAMMGASIVCGLCPKLAALVSIMPQSVLGGAAIIMFSSIVLSGIQLITKDPMSARNMSIVSVALGLGYGLGANSDVLAGLPSYISLIFGGSGIVPAALVAIILNIVLPREKAPAEEK